MHLLLYRWTKTLSWNIDYLFPRRLEAQNVVVSVAASKLETRDLVSVVASYPMARGFGVSVSVSPF